MVRDLSLQLNGGLNVVLKKNESFIISERALTEISLTFGDYLFQDDGDFDKYVRTYEPNTDLNGKTIFAFRSSGIGDLLALLTAFRELKRRYPKVKIKLGTHYLTSSILQNDPIVDEIIQFPYPLRHAIEADYVLSFQGIVEHISDTSTTQNMYDLFLSGVGIDPASVPRKNKIPKVYSRRK